MSARTFVTYHGHGRRPLVIVLGNEALPVTEQTLMQEDVMLADGIELARMLHGYLPAFEFGAMQTELDRLTKPATMPPFTSGVIELTNGVVGTKGQLAELARDLCSMAENMYLHHKDAMPEGDRVNRDRVLRKSREYLDSIEPILIKPTE